MSEPESDIFIEDYRILRDDHQAVVS